ncbi:MADS-box transcription factor 22-like [Pyrus x bretschneideri]|uniref:MADS-box transcription factor 22-like n=1 Tax=Pyrus x bretschneideri TaxID=225117 RepID=UPI00202DD92E|nr:MADS-box transcription factor 22-like [Pyrus x bretschneideri]
MKKAGELSILCESEAAVIIFSQTDKLLDFSSSSTNDVIARYKSHTSGEKSDQPTFDQLQDSNDLEIATIVDPCSSMFNWREKTRSR